MSRCVGWFRAWRNRRMRRNSQYRLTLRFERTACGRRQFIMRVHVLIKGICIGDHLIAEDLMVSTDPCSIALRFRQGEREQIEIKAGTQTAGRPDTAISIVEIPVRRGQAVSEIWCRCEFSPTRI